MRHNLSRDSYFNCSCVECVLWLKKNSKNISTIFIFTQTHLYYTCWASGIVKSIWEILQMPCGFTQSFFADTKKKSRYSNIYSYMYVFGYLVYYHTVHMFFRVRRTEGLSSLILYLSVFTHRRMLPLVYLLHRLPKQFKYRDDRLFWEISLPNTRQSKSFTSR